MKFSPLQRLRLLLVALVTVIGNSAWAEVAQATLERAEALIKSGRADDAYLLLEPLEVEGAGDSVYDYLLGTAALESNRPSKATFIYERILAVDPSYVGVRADMGRAYFALGDYGRAKIEFETVLTFQNLPPDLRGAVEQYVKAAEARAQDKRTVANGYFEIGFGRDNNVGSSTDITTFNFPSGGTYSPTAPSGLKTTDNYAALSLGGELNHQLNDKWGLFAGGDYRGRAYQTYAAPGNYTLDVRGGLSYAGGPWMVRTGLTAGNYIQNQASIRDTLGATLDWRMALNNTSQLSLGASIVRATYADAAQSAQDTQTYTLTGGWLTTLGDGTTVVSLSGSAGQENGIGGREDGDKRFYGPRLFVQKAFTDSVGGFASVGATFSKYSGTNSLYLLTREESLYDLTLGITWTLRRGLSMRPQLTYLKNTSNADLYSYDKTDASLNFRLDF